MLKLNRSAALILACAAALPLSACATGSKGRDTAYIARDVNTLYAAAQRTMQSGDYDRAPASLFDLGPARAADERIQLLSRAQV